MFHRKLVNLFEIALKDTYVIESLVAAGRHSHSAQALRLFAFRQDAFSML